MGYNLQQYKDFRESRKARNYPQYTDVVWRTVKKYVDMDTGEYISRWKTKGYYPEYIILNKNTNYESKGRFKTKTITYKCKQRQAEIW